MMDGSVLAALVGGGMASVVALLAKLARDGRKSYEETWRAVATRTGGTYEPRAGPWYAPTPVAIKASLEGVRVAADSFEQSTGRSSVTYTRVTARAPHVGGLTFKVSHRSLLTAVAKVFGASGIELGEAVFDGTFIVEGNDEGIVRAWLDDDEIRAGIYDVGYYTFGVEGGRVEALRSGLEDDAKRLERTMRTVALLAARPAALAEAWSTVAKTMGASLSDGLRLERPDLASMLLVKRGIGVTVQLVQDVRRTSTEVSAPRLGDEGGFEIMPTGGAPGSFARVSSEDDTFERAFVVYAERPPALEARLDAETRESILVARPSAVFGAQTRVVVVLEGLMMDAERLNAAIDTVVAFGMPLGAGPYR